LLAIVVRTKARRDKRNFSRRENMKASISSKQLSLAVACALALGFAASAARAQDVSRQSPNERELWENSTKTIWKSGFGLCWHSGFGPPPGYTECNPAPVAQYIAPVPVVVVAPPPAPVIAPAPEPLPPRKTRG
jgi:OOP family OmpA-OmpF porin